MTESDFSNVADATLFKSLSVGDIFLRTLQKLKVWKLYLRDISKRLLLQPFIGLH